MFGVISPPRDLLPSIIIKIIIIIIIIIFQRHNHAGNNLVQTQSLDSSKQFFVRTF